MKSPFDSTARSAEFRAALASFLERLQADTNILAAVLVGSIEEEFIWRKETLHLWIVEVDGVTKRLKSDGKEERIFRSFVEEGINIHAELIPRTRFKQMVEGTSRTAFSCNFFTRRELVYCEDPSIRNWFDAANRTATKDQRNELLIATTWAIESSKYARKRIERKEDVELGFEGLLWAVHSIAAIEVIRDGQVYEHAAIYKAMNLQPELFQEIYGRVLAKKRTASGLLKALDRVDQYLLENAEEYLQPVLKLLKKEKREVPLSFLSDHFASSQIYPWHLEVACEWLESQGHLDKLTAPYRITKKSRVEVEEPAYFCDLD